MASVYFEHLPPQKSGHIKGILLLLSCFFGAILSAGACMLFGTAIFPLNLLFAFLCVVLFATVYWLSFPYTSLEVEYCLAQDELRIDRIYAKRFRKTAVCIPTANVSRILAKKDAVLPKENVKDYTGANTENVFALYYREKDTSSSDSVILLHLPQDKEKLLYLACPRAQRR